jgi:general secretion pathway protein L
MLEWLLIRLPARTAASAEPDAVPWMVVDNAGHQVAPPGAASLAEIARMADQRRVVVIVPGVDVLALEAELPPLSGARLLQAIPFAVEEQLAEDVDTLHFAAGTRQPSGRTPIEIVSRRLVEEWLRELAAVGIAPRAMYADTGLLPAVRGHAVALLESADLAIRVDDRPVLRLPARPFTDAILLACSADAGSPLPPLTLYVSPADWQLARTEIEPMRERFVNFRVQLLPNGPLPVFAPRAVGAGAGDLLPVNLLQGAFAPRSHTLAEWRPWRLAAALGTLALALHLGALTVENRQLRASERALDAAIAEVVRVTLPGESAVENPRARIEQRLLAVRAGQGDSGPWLRALVALAAARVASPDAELQSMGLESGAVNVRIKAANAESLERISAALRAGGWRAELQAGNASENAYEGRIRLSMAGNES